MFCKAAHAHALQLFFFFTLVTGPRRSLSLKLGDTNGSTSAAATLPPPRRATAGQRSLPYPTPSTLNPDPRTPHLQPQASNLKPEAPKPKAQTRKQGNKLGEGRQNGFLFLRELFEIAKQLSISNQVPFFPSFLLLSSLELSDTKV